MTGLQVFDYGNWSIRTVDIDGTPWFVAKDVCDALGYVNGRDAVAKHVDVVDQSSVAIHDGTPGNPHRALVNESGVYALIFGSQLPQAQSFKRWVTADVLPAVRTTGQYVAPSAPAGPVFEVPTTMVEALQLALDQARQLEQLESKVSELQPAAEAWDSLAAADGDLSVRDAALVLQRDGIDIGERRLFARLRDMGWIDRTNRPYQAHCMNGTGRLNERITEHFDRDTGHTFVSVQPRVTAKGLVDLRRILTASKGLTVVS